jgi:glycerol-3-phosphate acyltransferase PlsY
MVTGAAALALGYVIGSVPVAWLVGRFRAGIDLRELGSGNVGASNVWQSVSRALVVPVGLAQIAQGAGSVWLARALDCGEGVQVAAGLLAIAAHDWNPWLGLQGGRGVGLSIGLMLALAPFSALPAFIVVALCGVPFNQSPVSVGAGLLVAPAAAGIGGEGLTVVTGCCVMAAIALLKRLLANGPPDAAADSSHIWLTRLVFDRDISDREAWIRRGVATGSGGTQHS